MIVSCESYKCTFNDEGTCDLDMIFIDHNGECLSYDEWNPDCDEEIEKGE